MHKRLVVNIFSSLLLGAALISAPVYAAEKTVVNISKWTACHGLTGWVKG